MSDDDDAATQWPTAQSYGKLSRADAALYLDRLGLSRELLDAAPSLELLRDLQSNHITHVPFESLSVHVSDWSNDEAPVNLGGGETVGLGETAFRRIVHLKRGGYCFSLNSTFALLLRRFGFRVSEQAARVFAHLGQDPAVSGYDWGTTSHQCAIVDWEGSDGRYFVDVGFGSTQPLFPCVKSCLKSRGVLADVRACTGYPSQTAQPLNLYLPKSCIDCVASKCCLTRTRRHCQTRCHTISSSTAISHPRAENFGHQYTPSLSRLSSSAIKSASISTARVIRQLRSSTFLCRRFIARTVIAGHSFTSKVW